MDFMAIWESIKSFALQSLRVWKILKKPSMQEFSSIAKISAIGILLIGAIGFGISTLIRLFS